MGIKSKLVMPAAKWTAGHIKKWSARAVADQDSIMQLLVNKARNTKFGRDHQFAQIRTYEDFKKHIPIRDYEGLRPYVEQIIEGESDVLWPGRPKYFAKTSGTTSGVKYIPLTKDSMPNHLNSAKSAMLNYLAESKDASVFDGKMIFISGSPELTSKGGIDTGRLSGIVNHEIPGWIKGNQLPSYETNCIDKWEEKLDRIVDETLEHDMRLISGIPPWVQMYYERILERTGKKTIKEVFPNLSLFMYGGVNFEPYRAQLERLIGERLPSVELYPAEVHKENPIRLKLDQVQLDKDYAVIINNNAGLWGYSIGDSIRFVSLDPYKIIVSGRIKHYISAFGEPYHEWFVEFDKAPVDLDAFATAVDLEMVSQNIYYEDLIQ